MKNNCMAIEIVGFSVLQTFVQIPYNPFIRKAFISTFTQVTPDQKFCGLP